MSVRSENSLVKQAQILCLSRGITAAQALCSSPLWQCEPPHRVTDNVVIRQMIT